MKKILTIALVALLAASSVFAGLSGYSNLGFGYNSSSKKFGFNPASGLNIDLDVATADGSKVGEGDIYAGIDASLKLRLVDTVKDKDKVNTYVYSDANDSGYYGFGVFAFINDVYIAGQNWKVSFGTASSNPVDFAKSPVDTYKTVTKDAFNNWSWIKDANVSYKAPYTGNSGLVATYKDYTLGVGFVGGPAPKASSELVVTPEIDGKTLVGFTTYFMTPSIVLENVSVKFGALASKAQYATKEIADNSKEALKAYTSAGASLEAGYSVDALSAKVAADLGLENLGKDNKFHFDVLGSFKYDFVALDVYFADYAKYDVYGIKDWTPYVSKTEEAKNLLSAKVAVDLASFEVPVSLTIKAKDLINKQDLSLSADIAVNEKLSLTVGGGYVINTKKVSVNGGVKYVADLFTASASAKFTLKGEDKTLVPEVVITSDALVNGATLELSWKANSNSSNETTTNLLKKDADWGKIYATAKISF